VTLLLGLSWQIGRVGHVSPRPGLPFGTVVAVAPGTACGNYGVPLYSDAGEQDPAIGQGASPALPSPLPGLVSGQFVQDLLLNLRDEIEQRRQELIDLQDDDFGGWERDDAWELVLPINLAVA